MLADRGTSAPKARDGYVEALRVLRTALTSAMKARTALLNQISGVLTSAADEVRAKYRGMTSEAMAVSRPSGDPADPVVATLMTLKRMGARHRFLSEEIDETDAALAAIVSTYAPEFLEVNGVGTVVASQLLVTFGDNPERMAARVPSRLWRASRPSRLIPGKQAATGSAGVVTGKRTARSTGLSWYACQRMPGHVPTSPNVPKTA